ncbi:MAG: transposase [Deltaproteobacteria bacterium]|nr:transposase [Deltaproteobacteria bacterium]
MASTTPHFQQERGALRGNRCAGPAGRERAKTVVLEATGVYWCVPYAFLGDWGFGVRLLNPRYVKNVLGKKTDVRDCQWLEKLASCGLAPECFAPPPGGSSR